MFKKVGIVLSAGKLRQSGKDKTSTYSAQNSRGNSVGQVIVLTKYALNWAPQYRTGVECISNPTRGMTNSILYSSSFFIKRNMEVESGYSRLKLSVHFTTKVKN